MLSQAKYTPAGSYNLEDTATKKVLPGQWRVDTMPTGTLLLLTPIPKKPSELTKQIGEEFTVYFNSAVP